MRSRLSLSLLAAAILVLIAGASCTNPLSFLQPTATSTLTPTATSTSTAVPTNTPTITPDRAATRQAQLAAEIRSLLDEAGLPSGTGRVGWVQTEPQEIEITGDEGYYNTFAEDVNAADFVIQTEMTWETDSWPSCGIYFRSDDQFGRGSHYTLYFLRFSGLPAWVIWYYKDGTWSTSITGQNAKFSSYMDMTDGATNAIMLAAQDNEFQLFVNGHFEGKYYDYSDYRGLGHFAFVAAQDAGHTTCSWDNTWIWVYK